ncbi:MAG: 50S ribosomal protein L18 [Deltaproteobacteria bacterium]|nr:50S ribosomal protein L18 [Deltaproteobacteria bacterium]
MKSATRSAGRIKRKRRVAKRIRGTSERPRLSVFKSAKHIYAQIVDDGAAKTLANASSMSKEFRSNADARGGNRAGAAIVGELIAKRAAEKGIKRVVFDRSGFLYHGRIKTLADSAREHGLDF